jgi:hypothetical protein
VLAIAPGTLALGNDMPKHCITPAARRAGVEDCQTRAAERAAKLAPIIAEIKAAGITRLSGIAAALNARGVLTPMGGLRGRLRNCQGRWGSGTREHLSPHCRFVTRAGIPPPGVSMG